MNKYEAKRLAVFAPYIAPVQDFVDTHIIGSKTMTAKEIAVEFVIENECVLTPNDFVNSFRLAIHENKIKGLEGAQRAGYRRIGAHVMTGTDAAIAAFAPHVSHAQDLVDKHIQGDNKMTTKAIFDLFLKDWLIVNPDQSFSEEQSNLWINGFRFAIRDRKITGIENAGKLGYKRSGYVRPPAPEPVATEKKETVVELQSDWSRICHKLHVPITSTGSAVLDAIQSLIEMAGLWQPIRPADQA